MIATAFEAVIFGNYCYQKGGCELFDPNGTGPRTDFFDEPSGSHRCDHMAAFLHLHDSHVDPVLLSTMCMLKKDPGEYFVVPDIVSWEPPPEQGEFYEIKPYNDLGLAGAQRKRLWFRALVANYNLGPYVPGKHYAVNARLKVLDGTWAGVPLKGYMRWELVDDGILLYRMCLETGLETLAETVVKAVMEAFILAILALAAPEGAVVGGLAALLAQVVMPRRQSPLRAAFGPPVPPASVGDVAYIMYLVQDRWYRHGGTGLNQIFFTPVKVGTDDEPWSPGDPEPWTWNAATMEAIRDIAPDGRFEPDGESTKALEYDHLMALASAVDVEALGPAVGITGRIPITDEEGGGSGDPLDPHQIVVDATSEYLQSCYDAFEYRATNGHW